MRSLLWTAAVLAAIVTTVPATADPVKIRIGWNQAPGHMASLAWADPKAPYLKYNGKTYIADVLRFQGTGHQVTALASDALDIAAVSVGGLVAMVKNAGLQAQVIGDVINDNCKPGEFSQPFYVRKDSGINSFADLKGKRIAINSRGSGHDMMVTAALRKGNVVDADVTRVEMQFGAMVPFLKEGKVDVGGYLPQFVPTMASDPNLKFMFNGCDVLGPTATVILVARKEFIAKNRAAMVDMMADLMGATRWFYEPANRKRMMEIVIDVTKGKPEDFADYVFTDRDWPRDRNLYVDPKVVQNTIDRSLELGAIKDTIKVVPDHADLTLVVDAKKKLEGG